MHPFPALSGGCWLPTGDAGASQGHLGRWVMGCPCLAGHTSRLLKALLGTSILFLLAHFVFQICLYMLPVLDQLLGPSCEYGVPGQPAMGVPTPALALPHQCSPRLHPLPAVPRAWTPKMVTCRCGDPIFLGAGGLLRLCGVTAAWPAPGPCCAVPGCPLSDGCAGHRPHPHSPHGEAACSGWAGSLPARGLPNSAPPCFPAGSTWEVLARHIGVTR